MNFTALQRIDRLRRGATVTRFHTHRMLRPQSVGEHSHGVAMLAMSIYRQAYGEVVTPATLILAALEHDLAEFDIGDMPAPAKRRDPALKDALDVAEHKVDRRLGLHAHHSLMPSMARLMGACDELEFLFTAFDEVRLGNTDFIRLFCLGSLGFTERLEKLKAEANWDWLEVARDLHAQLESAVHHTVGAERFTRALNEARAEKEAGR